jgi:hypothetical protein
MNSSEEEGPIESSRKGPTIVVEHMASVVSRMMKQSATVAKGVSGQIDDNKYGINQWMDAMTKLFDIALVGGIDLVQTAVIGPAPYTPTTFNSRSFDVKKTADHPRRLSIEAPGLTRPGTKEPIPADRITLVPDTLAPQQTKFHFRVSEEGLPSGVYTGRVRVGDNEEHVDVAIRL